MKNRTHDHPLFRTWAAMKTRCLNPNDRSYARYGGRGVTVCERWQRSFWAFVADMGPKPSPEHTLDRIAGGASPYSPENCRWATTEEQMASRNTARGSRSATARLTEAAVFALRRTHETGLFSGRRLARWFGVGKTTVQAVLGRTSWAHVP